MRAEEQDADAPFWKVWERKIKAAPPVEVTTADPAALPTATDDDGKKPEKKADAKAEKTDSATARKPANAEQPAQAPVVTTDSQPKEKPFWKIW